MYLATFHHCASLNMWHCSVLLFRLLCRSRSPPESFFGGGGWWSSTVQPEGQGRTCLPVLLFTNCTWSTSGLKDQFHIFALSRCLTSSWHKSCHRVCCVKKILFLNVVVMTEVSVCVCRCVSVCVGDVQVFIFTVDDRILRVISEVSGKEVSIL